MNKFKKSMAIVSGAVLLCVSCGKENSPSSESAESNRVQQEVNLYSARHYDNDLVLFKEFTEETGIRVNLIEAGGDALIERLASEGDNSPADVFITADAGVLWRAEVKNLLAATQDNVMEASVPAYQRHPDGKWFGLTKRGRIVIYNKEQGLPEGLRDYEDLASEAYRGMICVRSSSSVYNQSLLASIIAHHGAEAAEEWARGVVANFARNPQGNDTAQIEAVAAGQCRLGIVNTYYVARFVGVDDVDNRAIGDRIGVLFPNQNGRGAHMNISGGGIVATSDNKENALKLLQFLVSSSVQASFASGNNEYPVHPNVTPTGSVLALGAFKEDPVSVTKYGEYQRQAVEIFDRVGWQ